ncbi:hypothetical protein EI94DRAFT_1570364, partial [Lactarius quietus]
LFQVFLGAIAGYVPSAMVCRIASFMNACYIASCDQTYHNLCIIFLEVRLSIKLSMPCQHALSHFYQGIHPFSSPNGLFSSITKLKHIGKVKDHWQ